MAMVLAVQRDHAGQDHSNNHRDFPALPWLVNQVDRPHQVSDLGYLADVG